MSESLPYGVTKELGQELSYLQQQVPSYAWAPPPDLLHQANFSAAADPHNTDSTPAASSGLQYQTGYPSESWQQQSASAPTLKAPQKDMEQTPAAQTSAGEAAGSASEQPSAQPAATQEFAWWRSAPLPEAASEHQPGPQSDAPEAYVEPSASPSTLATPSQPPIPPSEAAAADLPPLPSEDAPPLPDTLPPPLPDGLPPPLPNDAAPDRLAPWQETHAAPPLPAGNPAADAPASAPQLAVPSQQYLPQPTSSAPHSHHASSPAQPSVSTAPTSLASVYAASAAQQYAHQVQQPGAVLPWGATPPSLGYQHPSQAMPQWGTTPYSHAYYGANPASNAYYGAQWTHQTAAAAAYYGAGPHPYAAPQPYNAPQPYAAPVWQQRAPVVEAAAPQVVEPPKALQPTVTDAVKLFRQPGRSSRPRKFVVVLRGLPGSGKTHIARKFREVELAEGGEAPRIHAIDDYFVTEVERETVDEKGKRKKVREMGYCYEAELEGEYKRSLMRAFSKTVEEGRFRIVIVDAPNARLEDFKDYWSIGQRAGYDVYVLQPLDMDPEACFKRNIHQRTREDIKAMAAQWEAAPPVWPHLSAANLLAGRRPDKGVTEIDMEDDSGSAEGGSSTAGLEKSRWAALEDAPGSPKRSKKARNAQANLDGLTDGLDTLLEPGKRAVSGKGVALKSVLSHGSSSRKRVSWADEAPQSAAGFRIGGASSQQLVTVYVLAGLGPPREQTQLAAAGGKSFADQVKREKEKEKSSFRDILLGHKGRPL